MQHLLFRRPAGLVGLVILLANHPARAQTDSSASKPKAASDSTAASSVGGLTPPPAGLPSAEFETYNINGNGVRYTAAVTGLYTTGTVERVYFSTNHTGNLTVKRWQFPVAASFSYGRQDGNLKEREWLLLTTPDYRIGRWKFYSLGEYEISNLRAIAHRVVVGGGVGYQIYADTTNSEVALSTFFLDENTSYDSEPPLRRNVTRNSTRLKLRLNRGAFSASTLLFYQPSLTNPSGDYRVNNSTVVAFKLYKHLTLNLTYTFSYESVVVRNRDRANSTTSIGFAFSSGK
ncbi:DUF481 domain-containing protein [Hymenobacter terrenus]|uniref:DUF481 domain-containing protein n=1 Tax=Hymenobacter terrenus TaxID=1629124 RepID=UPI0009E417B6|nr:DUF481 domain-containing protein [Hymenobacter terrenus]